MGMVMWPLTSPTAQLMHVLLVVEITLSVNAWVLLIHKQDLFIIQFCWFVLLVCFFFQLLFCLSVNHNIHNFTSSLSAVTQLEWLLKMFMLHKWRFFMLRKKWLKVKTLKEWLIIEKIWQQLCFSCFNAINSFKEH